MKTNISFWLFLTLLTFISCKKKSQEIIETKDSTFSATPPTLVEEDTTAENEEMEEVEVASGSNP